MPPSWDNKFFFDRRFSGPLRRAPIPPAAGWGQGGVEGMVSCATCHDPARGGADPRSQGGTSLAAGWTGRNSPTVINAAHARWQFWDGRKDSLWSQALGADREPGRAEHQPGQVARVIFEHYRRAVRERCSGRMPTLDDQAASPMKAGRGWPAFDAMAADDKVAVNKVFANFGKAIEAYERLLVDQLVARSTASWAAM